MSAIAPEIFKAYDIRGLYGSQIDGDLAEQIGRAFARNHASIHFLLSHHGNGEKENRAKGATRIRTSGSGSKKFARARAVAAKAVNARPKASH